MKRYCTSSFWICLVVSVLLMVGSFFVPPMGIIDGSVLAAVGELFAFASLAALLRAIDKNVPARVSHSGTTVEVNPKDTAAKEAPKP